MPLCGFNKQMLDGLKQFHLGLVEHGVLARSKSKGIPVNQTIQNELADMRKFLKETDRIKDPAVRNLVETLTEYATAFYKLLEKRKIGNYKELILAIENLYSEMDKKYYEELEEKQNNMEQLAEHLNSINVLGGEQNATKRI